MKINQFNSFFNVYLAKETVRNAKQNRITFIIIIFFFKEVWKKGKTSYGLDYVSTHYCTFIYLIKDYLSFLP